jgi:hypothetical protein
MGFKHNIFPLYVLKGVLNGVFKGVSPLYVLNGFLNGVLKGFPLYMF